MADHGKVQVALVAWHAHASRKLVELDVHELPIRGEHPFGLRPEVVAVVEAPIPHAGELWRKAALQVAVSLLFEKIRSEPRLARLAQRLKTEAHEGRKELPVPVEVVRDEEWTEIAKDLGGGTVF